MQWKNITSVTLCQSTRRLAQKASFFTATVHRLWRYDTIVCLHRLDRAVIHVPASKLFFPVVSIISLSLCGFITAKTSTTRLYLFFSLRVSRPTSLLRDHNLFRVALMTSCCAHSYCEKNRPVVKAHTVLFWKMGLSTTNFRNHKYDQRRQDNSSQPLQYEFIMKQEIHCSTLT